MNIPRMSYPQYRKARRLTHECCNYCNGNCLLLDDGEECVCVQSISYSLLCRWFKVAVLPLDAALCAEITKGREEIKRCAVCGAAFTPNSNRAKYCPDCAVQVRRKKEAERQRKRYLLSTHLHGVKVGDLALDRLNGVALVDGLHMEVHHNAVFRVEEVGQHFIRQLRGEDLQKTHRPVFAAQPEHPGIAEAE